MFVENLEPFFADHGITAVVGGTSVTGIFDNAFASAFGITAGTSPMLIVKLADLPSVAQDVAVTIGAASYTVAGVEPDGTGMLLLRLQEA